MKRELLVSAIIPTYNRIDLLKDAINSVLNQTYKNIEIIVVNDGGSDRTEEVLQSYIRQNKIKYIYQNNKGLSAARNTGIKNAKGDLIAFLDDDDTWDEIKIQLQVKKLKNNQDAIMCTCGVKINYLYTKMSYNNYPNIEDITFDKMLFRNYMGISSCILVWAKIFNEIGYYDETLPAREDYDFHIRISKHYKVTYVNKVLVNYLIHENPNKQMNSGIERFKIANKLIYNKYNKYYKNFTKELLNIRLSTIYFQYSTICINNQLKKQAIIFILMAIKRYRNIRYYLVLLSYFFGLKGYIYLKIISGAIIKINPRIK